jgi:BirA family biotin operon repressor/biotin-[acetyl-CoA-carboxylase] ligase
MSGRHEVLLGLLSDGALHSGADLAARLGVSRAAVWKLVGELREREVPVDSHPRRGYRLPRPVELLEPAAIERAATAHGRSLRRGLEVLFETASTNAYLHDAPPPPPGQPRVVFAELQRAGRGRRGRSWVAPFGSGLTFSIAWTFAETPADLPALGLAIGVAVAEALRSLGLPDVQLKWPNDVVWRGRKLGGLLLQLRAEAGGAASVVAGLGLNVDLPQASRTALASAGGLEAADLREAFGAAIPSRNALAGVLAGAILTCLEEFEHRGFAEFSRRWAPLDALAGERVRVVQGENFVDGVARGADADGALLLDTDGRTERFYSGDVSLRPIAGPAA